mmetsp:Transcript_28053/g.52960  ORF Transcript_28053/g.52960 Transcript_28053/m.52960 type:complete len:848 (-) Transcript_28053:3693-6236(-)
MERGAEVLMRFVVAEEYVIALGHGNSARMGDDRKLMPEGAHQAAMMPSRNYNEPTALRGGRGGSEARPMPVQQKSEERSGDQEHSMVASRYDRGRDSPPKLSFCQVPRSNIGAKIRRPVTLRPTSLESCTSFPSLKHVLDEETDVPTNLPLATASWFHKRLSAPPHLCIRPILKKELKLSSPLVRRGAAEREYLQGQLKAEALRRRKQEQHNEERKLKWNSNIPLMSCFKDDKPDEDILSMKFKFGFKGCAPMDGEKSLHKRSHKDLREFAASPPAILKKTFKRSVSAVLADSGIDEDGNLLFFPDGVPLLRDDDETFLDEVADGTDSDRQDSSDEGMFGDRSEEESVSGSTSQVTSSDDELSPSLIPADVLWQLGACGFDDLSSEFAMPTAKGNKKVTLRPKMNAPQNNIRTLPHPNRQLKPISSCKSSNNGQAKSVIQADQNKDRFKFKTPDKFYPGRNDILAASESFQRLSFGSEDEKIGNGDHALSSERPCQHRGIVEKKESFVFSSPETGFNINGKLLMNVEGTSLLPQAPPSDFSESNYCTPDNSEHNRRRKKFDKMLKVPQLTFMRGMVNLNSQRIRLQGEAPLAVEASAEEVAIGFSLKEPLSDSNFRTPDNSFNERRPFRKNPGERMPKLPEFTMPDIESSLPRMRFQGGASLALDAVVKEESAFSPEIIGSNPLLEKPMLESNFRTPDSSFNDRRSSRRHLGVQMPKLPEFSMPDIGSEGKASLALGPAREETKEMPLEIVTSSLLLEKTLSESNLITPDNTVDPFRKHLAAQMPKLPELNMPDTGSESESLLSLNRAAEEESQLSPEIEASALLLRKTHLEFNFCTPDDTVHPLPK